MGKRRVPVTTLRERHAVRPETSQFREKSRFFPVCCTCAALCCHTTHQPVSCFPVSCRLRAMVDFNADDGQTTDSKQEQVLQYLRSLSALPDSCVSVRRQVITIPLSPAACGEEEAAVRKAVMRIKYSYVSELKGFLIGFDELELADKCGSIKGDLPFIFWHVTAHFFVFSPVVGSIISARIQKFSDVTSSTITCLVHESIPATISLPVPLPPVLSPYIRMGKEIRFCITKIDFGKCLLCGDLTEACIQLMNQQQ